MTTNAFRPCAVLFATLVAAHALPGCRGETIQSDPSVSQGASTDGQDATSSEEPDTAPKTCPTNLPGPKMVQIDVPGGASYCIDSTEVTQAHWFEFVDAFSSGVPLTEAEKKAAEGLPEYCPESLRFGPLGISAPPCDSTPEAFDFKRQHPDFPVACLSWCHAYAYCKWASKRLCGRIGGGALGQEEVSSEASQWYYACSQGGKTAYAYGDTYDAAKCRKATEYGALDAASECRGTSAPFDEILNLSGSLAEWEDACVRGKSSVGCYAAPYRVVDEKPASVTVDNPACNDANLFFAQEYMRDVGFRCCLDL